MRMWFFTLLVVAGMLPFSPTPARAQEANAKVNTVQVTLDVAPQATYRFLLRKLCPNRVFAAFLQNLLTGALQNSPAFADAEFRAVAKLDYVSIVTWPVDEKQARTRSQTASETMERLFGKKSYIVTPDSYTFTSVARETEAILLERVTACGYKVISTKKAANRLTMRLEYPHGQAPDNDALRALLTRVGRVEFRLIPDYVSIRAEVETGDFSITASGKTLTTAEMVADAYLVIENSALSPTSSIIKDHGDRFAVSFHIEDPLKREQFSALTAGSIGRQLAIVTDGTLLMAPVIQDRLPGEGIISGLMDETEANWLVTVMNTGALPAPVTIVSLDTE